MFYDHRSRDSGDTRGEQTSEHPDFFFFVIHSTYSCYFTRSVGNQYCTLWYVLYKCLYDELLIFFESLMIISKRPLVYLTHQVSIQLLPSTFSMQLSSGKDSCWKPKSKFLCAQWNLSLLLSSFHPFHWLLQRLIRIQVQ